jgi:hypothetical protein
LTAYSGPEGQVRKAQSKLRPKENLPVQEKLTMRGGLAKGLMGEI